MTKKKTINFSSRQAFKIICIKKLWVFNGCNKFRNLFIMNIFVIILDPGLFDIHVSKISAKELKTKFFK